MTEDKHEVAVWLNKVTSDFMNSFPWYRELSPAQHAAHRVSQQINTDCHNGYLSGIFQKMVKVEPYRLQHQAYTKVNDEISRDDLNRKPTGDIPEGVILRRLLPCTLDNFDKPIGKLCYEVKGTLFIKGKAEMLNTCKGTKGAFKFIHPWYWEIPSTEEIEKVMGFMEPKILSKIEESFKGRDKI